MYMNVVLVRNNDLVKDLCISNTVSVPLKGDFFILETKSYIAGGLKLAM